MQRIKFMYRQFMSEPLWFKIFVISMLLIAIIFSSSAFSENTIYQGIAKLATAVFFITYGVKFRRSIRLSIPFFLLAVISLFLSGSYFIQAI